MWKTHRLQTRAAAEEGIVAGGGAASSMPQEHRKLKGATEDEQIGIDLVRMSPPYPLKNISNNAGPKELLLLRK